MNKNVTKQHLIKVFILSIAVILWMTLIFGYSSEVGSDSSKKSGKLLVLITNMVAPSLDATMDNYQSIDSLKNCERILRKFAHMFEYGILALLLWLLICEISCFISHDFIKINLICYILAECAVIVIGTIDEINQTHILGRTGSPFDVLIDGIGGAIVLFVCGLFKSYFLKSGKQTFSKPQ